VTPPILTEGEAFRITGVPSFTPEILPRVRLGDPMKRSIWPPLEQLAEKEAIQLFASLADGNSSASPAHCTSTCRPGATRRILARDQSRIARLIRRLTMTKRDDPGESKASATSSPRPAPRTATSSPVILARNIWDLRTMIDE
jgi:hypothetical protein